MSSFGKRLITTFTAVPLLFCIIFFLPQLNYLAFSVVVVLAALVGSHEMVNMAFPLSADGKREKPLIPFWLPSILPVVQWVEITFVPALDLLDITLIALFIIAFIVEIFRGSQDKFTGTLSRVSHTTFLIVYPSFFTSFLIRLFVLDYTTYYLLLMFLLVFGNDVFAYLFGMWLGKNNRGVFKVSPNKSVAGFIGGAAASIILGIAMVSLVPELSSQISVLQAGILGLVISFTANAGDLIESAFKRSAGLKDSGTIIPGRGGLLDSIDSIIVSAPAFLLLLTQWIL
jgi:phosphatidate cytidylyltransferase